MGELFTALKTLIGVLLEIVNAINAQEEKRLARDIAQIHIALQTIIDDAFMMFDLIKTAEQKIDEYGSTQYSHIIKENFHDQVNRIRQLYILFHSRELSAIIKNLNKRQSRLLWGILNSKSSAIYEVSYRLHECSLRFEKGELYAVKGKKKVVAFPNIKRQFTVLQELKSNSDALSKLILDKIKFRDLL